MASRKKGDDDASGDSNPAQMVAMARGLAEVVADHNLSELIFDTKEVTITVRRGGVVVAAPAPALAMPAVHALPPVPMHAPAPAAPPAAAAPAAAVDEKAHVVTSPFVGTFYRKPNPDSPAYVSLGDKVEKGQVLCIVEAMKLMNEIEADVAGTITAVLVEDNQPVEYGQQLFKIS